MASRYDQIIIRWTADFRGFGQKTIELTPDDQEDPRLLALLEWWEEQQHAKQLAAGPADPTAFM